MLLLLLSLLNMPEYPRICLNKQDSSEYASGPKYEKRLQHRCFPMNTAIFLGTSIMKNVYKRLLLALICSVTILDLVHRELI